jgi:hypothetical protein
MEDILLGVEDPWDHQDHLVCMMGNHQGVQNTLLVHLGSHREDSLLALEDHCELGDHYGQEDLHALEDHHVLGDHHVPEAHHVLGDHHVREAHHVLGDHHVREAHRVPEDHRVREVHVRGDRHGLEGHYSLLVLIEGHRILLVQKEDLQMDILQVVLLGILVLSKVDSQGRRAGQRREGSCKDQMEDHEESEMEGCEERECQMGENVERELQLVLVVEMEQVRGCLVEEECLFLMMEDWLSLE